MRTKLAEKWRANHHLYEAFFWCAAVIPCHGCNTALGNVRDSKERLLALVDYLERFE